MDRCETGQQATSETVEVAWADQGDTGERAKEDAAESGIELRVRKLPEVLAALHFLVFAVLMPPKAVMLSGSGQGS